jgi:hypothetical protein
MGTRGTVISDFSLYRPRERKGKEHVIAYDNEMCTFVQ